MESWLCFAKNAIVNPFSLLYFLDCCLHKLSVYDFENTEYATDLKI